MKPQSTQSAQSEELIDQGVRSVNDTDAIESWLAVFARLVRLPDTRKQAICAELHEHLHERVRDLMLCGHSETQSIQQAIEELGETANLAQRFESANRVKQRRLFMNLSIIGIAVGAVAVGLVATQAPRRSPSVFDAKSAEGSVVSNDAKLTIEANDSLGAIIESIPRQTSLGLSVDWGALEPLGFTKVSPWGMTAKDLPVQRVLELIAERLGPTGDRIAWRFDGRTLAINTARYFDGKELVLACYDVHAPIDAVTAVTNVTHGDAANQLREVTQNLVEPENWRDNGGELAAMYFVGDRMFVQAPPRMQKRIEWILQQINSGGEVKEGGQSKADGVPIIDQFFKPGAGSAVPPVTFSPGNGVNVEIFNLIEQGVWYKATRTVDAEGNIRLPMLGDVRVAGLKPSEVEQAIVGRLNSEGILKDPVITVYAANGPAQLATIEGPTVAAPASTR